MPRSKCHLMLTTTNYVLGILFKLYLIKTGVSGKDRWQSSKIKKNTGKHTKGVIFVCVRIQIMKGRRQSWTLEEIDYSNIVV